MPAGPKCCSQTLDQQLWCFTEAAHVDKNSPEQAWPQLLCTSTGAHAPGLSALQQSDIQHAH